MSGLFAWTMQGWLTAERGGNSEQVKGCGDLERAIDVAVAMHTAGAEHCHSRAAEQPSNLSNPHSAAQFARNAHEQRPFGRAKSDFMMRPEMIWGANIFFL